jgi:DNA-binding transcriptional LysR family regulator
MSQLLGKLDLNLLRVFEAIYTARNISRAADSMRVSQPTMSNALSRLRDTLDDPLFLREARGVKPTKRADDLIGSVRRILMEVATIVLDEDEFNPRTSTREFRINIVDALEPVIMPSLVKEALDSQGISYSLLLSAGTPAAQSLHSAQADLVVNLPTEIHEDLQWEALTPLDLVVVARKDHPQYQGQITPDQMKMAKWAILDLNPGRMANAGLLRATRIVELQPAVRVSRVGTMIDLVTQSDLLSVVPRLLAQCSPSSDKLQMIEVPWSATTQEFHLSWHSRMEDDPGLKWLRAVIHKAVAEAKFRNSLAA